MFYIIFFALESGSRLPNVPSNVPSPGGKKHKENCFKLFMMIVDICCSIIFSNYLGLVSSEFTRRTEEAARRENDPGGKEEAGGEAAAG